MSNTPNQLSVIVNKLTKAKFKRWLKKQPDRRRFDCTSPISCIIASFVSEVSRVRVRCGCYYIRRGDVYADIKPWMVKAQRATEYKVVTAKKLKEILL